MKPTLAIGIDIGGTNTKIGLVDKSGVVLEQEVISTTDHYTPADYISAIAATIDSLLGNISKEQVKGVGVGAPNGNYYTGEIVNAVNLPWKGVIPFADMLKEEVGFPVSLTNDANASAMGEMIYGAAKGMKDFVMITLGTGVGSGIVANGQLIYGHDGFAGELGHVIAVPGGRDCGCGRRGCMEKYCSATGIVITAKEWLTERDDESVLRENVEVLTGKMITDAAKSDDKVAIEVFDYTAKILASTLANAVAITSPEAIIIFGGPAETGDKLFEPLRKYFEEEVLFLYKNKVKILPSALPGADAAITGAAALAWQ